MILSNFSFNHKKKYIYELFSELNSLNTYNQFLKKIFKKSIFFENIILWLLKKNLLKLFFYSIVLELEIHEIISIRKKIFTKNKNIINYKKSLKELNETGFCDLTQYLKIESEKITEIKNYFNKLDFYNSQVPFQSDHFLYPYYRKNEFNYISFDIHQSLNCDLIKSFILNPLFKNFADAYLGFSSELYSVNTTIVSPSKKKHPVTNFHRDTDDFKFLTFFVYFDDVTYEDNATVYLDGSHNDIKPDYKKKYLTGKKGTIYAADTFGLHAGPSKINIERLSCWFRYGYKINSAYMGDRNFYFI